ncbi:MAG: inorganic diphosphatase [Phycisphaerae bacterium]|nr:inorganic diphosphatase [Phycisphaerae bacterium]
MNLDQLDAFDDDKEQWRVIIETPKGSRNKFDFNKDLGVFELSKTLPEGMNFPFDFGFIPSTEGDDGDPIDVMLLMDQATFSGCLIYSRLIGVIEATQTQKDGTTVRNDRLVAVPESTRNFRKVHSMNDLDKHMLDEIEQFFIDYNQQDGKKFKLLGMHGPHKAESLAEEGIKLFHKHHRSGRKKARKGK